MTEQIKFASFEQAIEHIISTLDESEKDMIRHADPTGLHMALDRWIINDYVMSGTTNINELIHEYYREQDEHLKNNPGEQFSLHPDNLSGIIIDELYNRLRYK